jgi:hypothetical protein
MSETLTITIPGGVVVRQVKQTPEQKAAAEKMLASPCPYCSDPAKFQRELKGKGRKDHEGLITRAGKFWKRGEGMFRTESYDHGDHFRITIGSKNFIPRFKDFRLDIISFPAEYSPFFWASHYFLFLLDAAPSDLARRNKFGLNVTRITSRKSPVVLDAHTWFSHGTLLTFHHVPKEMSSADVSAMREALEFFRPETRGAPKVKDIEVFQAIKALGKDATQAKVAKRLGVGKSTLGDWLKRVGWTWSDLKRSYLAGDIL